MSNHSITRPASITSSVKQGMEDEVARKEQDKKDKVYVRPMEIGEDELIFQRTLQWAQCKRYTMCFTFIIYH